MKYNHSLTRVFIFAVMIFFAELCAAKKIFSAQKSAGEMGERRSDVIERELNCAEQYVNTGKTVSWDAFCYTDRDSLVENTSRSILNKENKTIVEAVLDNEGKLTVEKEDPLETDVADFIHPSIEEITYHDESIARQVKSTAQDLKKIQNRMHEEKRLPGLSDIQTGQVEQGLNNLEAVSAGHPVLAANQPDSFAGDGHPPLGLTDWDAIKAAHERAHQEVIDDSSPSFYEAVDLDNPLNGIEFGIEPYLYQYREPGLMELNGYFYGLFGGFTHRFRQNQIHHSWQDAFRDGNTLNYLNIDVRLMMGNLDYTSSDGSSGENKNEDHYVFEGRGVLGYDIPYTASSRVTPYFGIGYRYLYDNSGGSQTTTGAYTYDRESRYVYLPVGLTLESQWQNNWAVQMTLEYDYFLGGKQRTHFEDLGYSIVSSRTGLYYYLDPLNNNQDEGYGLRGAIKLSKKTSIFHFFFEPFIRYWKIKESDKTQLTSGDGTVFWYLDSGLEHPLYGYEPENDTLEYGIKLGLRY